ncbi:hypothetical protein Tco_1066359 [Tanacetum coccineum]|uniref:Reverse transcriptase Ty1/copia-type domain-containing protein n=1 Tax=Tanacetum coccineum TaxID=301880 RepID=A0ABQ5HBK7_9ASTR
MDDEPMWAADRVVAPPTPGSAITIPETANEFSIKGNHLTLVEGNQFDGRTKTDPHKHIHEFLGICDMFKYRDNENEAVRLMMFPLSLTEEAKTCPRGIFINQSKYALDMLKKYGLDQCDLGDIPMVERLKLDKDPNRTLVDPTRYQGCQDSRKSTSGSAQFLGEKLVSWSSKKQKCTAISTTEAKYISLSGCCVQILWMRS